MPEIAFNVNCTPAPQGSMKAFVVAGRARITSDNKNTMPYRHIVARVAAMEMSRLDLPMPLIAAHQPVRIVVTWTLEKPPSAPKRRLWPAYKPDGDKLLRSTLDALKGILWADDDQVCDFHCVKRYGSPSGVWIYAESIEDELQSSAPGGAREKGQRLVGSFLERNTRGAKD